MWAHREAPHRGLQRDMRQRGKDRRAGHLSTGGGGGCPRPSRVPVVLARGRRDFLTEWREACAAGELDGAVLDMHPYYFTPWSNEVTRGLVLDQAER